MVLKKQLLTSPASDHGNTSHRPGFSVLLLVICQTQDADLITAQFENCKLHTFIIETSSFQQPQVKKQITGMLQRVQKGYFFYSKELKQTLTWGDSEKITVFN